MIEEAIHTILTNHVGVSGHVSDRVYPHASIPQSPTYPLVTYELVSLAERPHAMGDDPALVTDTYQVDAWAEGYLEMINLSTELVKALSRYRGTAAGVEIDAVLHTARRDLHEDTVRVHRRSNDFDISWYET